MLESIVEYWFLWIALVVIIPVLIFAMIKASKAAKKRNEIMKKQQQEFLKLKELAKKYASVTKKSASLSPAKELCEGITAVLQYELEKSAAPDTLFNSFDEWRKTVYALTYFDEDVNSSLSFFFKNNGGPVPSIAVKGINDIGYEKINSYVREMFSMYDESNETVSIDYGRVEVLDEKFKAAYSEELFFEKVKEYIIRNL